MATTNLIDVSGKLVSIDRARTKNDKEIVTLLIETDAPDWMREPCIYASIKVFGRTVEACSGVQKGAHVRVLGRIQSRQYQDRWYTDAVADKIMASAPSVQTAMPATDADEPPPDGADIPF